MVATPNTPVVNAGNMYVDNLAIAYTNATSFILADGAARDSTNINDIILSNAITININAVGANGVDIAFTANRVYSLYVIGDSTSHQPTAGILSLNVTTPSMPFGYDMFRRIGFIYINISSEIEPFFQYGKKQDRIYYYNSPITILAGGASATLANVALPVVQSRYTEVYFAWDITAGAASTAQLAPFGTTSTTGNVVFSIGAASTVKGMVWANIGLNGVTPTIKYMISAGTLDLAVAGFKDFIQ